MSYGVTAEEKAWLMAHPFDALKISEAKDIAMAKTRELFRGGQHNTVADAFRHCYWSALMTVRIGARKTREFSTWHETKMSNPFDEWRMDLHNNQVGIEIGERGGDDVELARQCAAALPRLWVIQ